MCVDHVVDGRGRRRRVGRALPVAVLRSRPSRAGRSRARRPLVRAAHPVAAGRRHEGGHERHHADPAVAGERDEHVVRHVARVSQTARAERVAEDHRCSRDPQRVAHDVGRHVREVHEHADPVHLRDDLLAERRLSPPSTGSSVAESAHDTFSLCVSVMYRTPRARIIRSVPSDSPIEWPPSMPSSDATRPGRDRGSTSSAVRRGRARPGSAPRAGARSRSARASRHARRRRPVSSTARTRTRTAPPTPPAAVAADRSAAASSPASRSTASRS